jgi:hypothetical protein
MMLDGDIGYRADTEDPDIRFSFAQSLGPVVRWVECTVE